MPKLVCRSCGQGVYTTAPLEHLFADERRCPRCSQLMFNDRRSGANRRRAQRRRPIEAMAASPGALPANAPTNGSSGNGATPHEGATASGQPMQVPVGALVAAASERRSGDRRQLRRRRDDLNPFQRASEEAGWVE